MKRHQKQKISYLTGGLVLVLAFQNCTQSDYAVVTRQIASVDASQELAGDMPEDIGSDAPQAPVEPPISEQGEIKYVEKVAITKVPNEVDILIVGDNSGSMKYEQLNMSQRFPSFIENLQNFNWRLGITTTDVSLQNGSLVPWKSGNANCGDKVYIDASISDANKCFENTIQLGSTGSGNEEGIHSANLVIQKNQKDWMRSDSHLAIVVLSDEDEKSDGTKLGTLNQPESILDSVKSKFNNNKSVSFHSIVVNDSICLEWQKKSDPYTKDGYLGSTYMKASKLMNGIIGSVCQSDYSAQLISIGNRIRNSIGALNLECKPVVDQKHTIKISINNVLEPSLKYRTSDTQIFFDDQIEIGADIKVEYVCAETMPVPEVK